VKRPAKPSRGRKSGKTPLPEQPIVKNGWTLFAHPLLLDQLDTLERNAGKERNPQGDATKVLAWLTRAIFDEIPQDPTLAGYRQGHTLGKGNTHWFRDKYAGRFRLFFRYDSKSKIIIFAWVNDENTLRTRGAKNDAYAVFKDMLDDGNPPTKWAELLKTSSTDENVRRLKPAAARGQRRR
jgi:toxin YhaV